jgi:hypothetical protein
MFILKCLAIYQFILNKTESRQVIAKDVDIFLCSILILLSSDNNAIKLKATSIFNSLMSILKKSMELSSIDLQLELGESASNEEDL